MRSNAVDALIMRVTDPWSARKLRGEPRNGLSTARKVIYSLRKRREMFFLTQPPDDGGDGYVRELENGARASCGGSGHC